MGSSKKFMRLIEAKRNKTPSPRPIILNDALPHSSGMEAIPTFLLVVWFLDGSIVWGRGCPTSASDTSMSAWKYLIFSWNITEIAWKILKCQCLAIVETRLKSSIFISYVSSIFHPSSFQPSYVQSRPSCGEYGGLTTSKKQQSSRASR